MLLSYTDYKKYGGTASKEDYDSLYRKAERILHYFTCRRLYKMEFVPVEVEECIIDLVNYEESLLETGGQAITSESTDTYQIEYAIPTTKNKKVDIATHIKQQIIREHLLHTGLLYRGVRPGGFVYRGLGPREKGSDSNDI